MVITFTRCQKILKKQKVDSFDDNSEGVNINETISDIKPTINYEEVIVENNTEMIYPSILVFSVY